MEHIATADQQIMHHNYQEEADEEDTLSLCDLPIYSSDCSDWENENQSFSSSFSSSSSDQDCFEFYSEEWSNSSMQPHKYPLQRNIVFCGKIIPYKDIPASNTPNNSPSHESGKRRGIFRWKSVFVGKARSKRQPKLGCDQSAKSMSMPTNGKYGTSLSGVSSPVKFRWLNLLMLGLETLPEEMDLSENKTKQQRRRWSPDGKVPRGKVLWRLIRGLGCGSYNSHRLCHQHPHQPSPVNKD